MPTPKTNSKLDGLFKLVPRQWAGKKSAKRSGVARPGKRGK